ncbi:MAG: class I SAM-dependent methyltransferase [Pseudomonadota bacterium]
MSNSFSQNLWNILACPNCGLSIQKNGDQGTICQNCYTAYEYTELGQLNLHLKEKKNYLLEFAIEAPSTEDTNLEFNPLREKANPEVDYSCVTIPRHLTKEILSYFPKANQKESLMLDLGCCNTIHRGVCEHAGFEYVGLDYNAHHAPILGDAHALPFQDNSFEFVLSIAVLQHIRFPSVMMREVCRVLKPNGIFIGTVSFLEPNHDQVYYNYSHLGTYNILQYGGFTVEQIAPSDNWTVLTALASMEFFPQMPRFLSQSLVSPLDLIHKLWWRIGAMVRRKPNESRRIRNFTGAFTYIAIK